MKILLVHNYYSQRGGEDSYVSNLIKLFGAQGHQVIAYTKDSRSVKTLSGLILSIKPMFSFDNRIEKDISNVIKASKPDIAHFNNVFPLIGPVAYEACRNNKLPIVQTIHNYRFLPEKEASFGYDNYRSAIYKKLFQASIELAIKKRVFDLVDGFIFPTMFSKGIYLKNARFTINKASVIPHFVDVPKNVAKPKTRDTFIFAGRFSKEKGVLPLLEIFSKLPDRKLLVVGAGPQKEAVEKYKRFNNIKVIDWVDRKTLFKHINLSLALISPSLSYEVMPLSVIESLALKTRVIVPNGPIYREIIKDRADAVFFNKNDFNDLKDKIVAFDKMLKVKTDYAKIFSPDNHSRSLIKLYNSIL